jgi:hypothetical protein
MKLTERDKYLRKKFEITEAEFNSAFVGQGSVCKGCHRPPGTRSLHVDHSHEIEQWKIATKRIKGGWVAWPENGKGRLDFSQERRTKVQARTAVKKILKRISCRGILCWHCNAGLKRYDDDPFRFHNIADYLDEYEFFLDGTTDERNGFKE